MLGSQDIEGYFSGLKGRILETLQYYEEREDWSIERDPRAAEIIEKIGSALSSDDASERIRRAPHSELLAFLAHVGLKISVRSTARIMTIAPGLLTILMEMSAKPGTREWTWQKTTLNRLQLLARLSLLRDMFDDEQISKINQAIKIARERDYFA